MKKITFAVLLLCLATFIHAQRTGQPVMPGINLESEPRIMINVHKGYSMGLGSTFKFYPDDISNITVVQNGNDAPQKTIAYSNPTKGLGDGFKFGFGASYILNDFINIGLDFDYFNSTIKKNRDSSFYRTNITNNPNGADEYRYVERNLLTYQATLLSLTPNITFKAISGQKWFIYNKLGAVITFRPNSLQKDVTTTDTRMGWQGFYQDSSSNTLKKYEWGIRNPALGFMGAIGVQVKVAERVRAYAEAQFSHIVFVIRKRTLTDFIVDTKDLKSTFPVSMRELDFVRSFSSDSGNNDPNKPSQTIVQRIPITYVGIQLGFAYQF